MGERRGVHRVLVGKPEGKKQLLWHGWGKGEVCTGFWLGNLRERNNLENLGVDMRMILK
jgi:hypothetical protein